MLPTNGGSCGSSLNIVRLDIEALTWKTFHKSQVLINSKYCCFALTTGESSIHIFYAI